jgi:hypothetical protein
LNCDRHVILLHLSANYQYVQFSSLKHGAGAGSVQQKGRSPASLHALRAEYRIILIQHLQAAG